MNLSPAFIVKQLQNSYEVSISAELSKNPYLICPTIYAPGMELKDYMVYIINKTEIKTFKNHENFPKHCLFIIMDEKTNVQIPNKCTLYGTDNYLTIFSDVLRLFEFYSNWQNKLLDACFANNNIETILFISMPVLKNSLLLIEMDFTILAAAYVNSKFYHESVFGSSQSTHLYVTSLKNNTLFNKAQELDGVFYFPSSVTGTAFSCVNIKHNNKTLYRLIMLEDNQKIDKSEGFILKYLANLIQHMVITRLTRPLNQVGKNNRIELKDKRLTKIFLDIINYENVEPIWINQKLNAEGWLSNHEYACIYIKLTRIDIQNYTYNPMLHYLNNIFVHSNSFLHEETIITFVNMSLSRINLDELINGITEFSKESLLKAGISSNKKGHLNLRYLYLQAQIALLTGTTKFVNKQTHLFKDICFDYILNQLTKELPISMIVHEKLLCLINKDKTNNTNYMTTLRVYLENKCNVTQAAKKLFIHRSTLMYRLDKIKEILGSELNDPDELLYIMLSFHLLDTKKKKTT